MRVKREMTRAFVRRTSRQESHVAGTYKEPGASTNHFNSPAGTNKFVSEAPTLKEFHSAVRGLRLFRLRRTTSGPA